MIARHSSSRTRALARYATGLALAGLLLSTGACSPLGPTLRFLIPQGYAGMFRVDFETPGAPPLPREGSAYLLQIPPSGWLKTSSSPERECWLEYYYISGTNRQRLSSMPNDPQRMIWEPVGSAVHVRGSGSADSGYHDGRFVGTKQQFQAAGGFGRIGPVQNALWLTGKDLREARLRGANRRNAKLKGVNLQGNDLRNVNLTRATLIDANLSATLTGATLRGANLQGADLFEAYLEGADLTDANLEGAQLEGANLTHAKLVRTNLRGATYDIGTRWPAGFRPQDYGARQVAALPGHNRARYLIPQGYVGWIRVDYGVAGKPRLRIDQDDYRVVRFPPDGRVETASPVDFGPFNIDYFYYSGDQRQPLAEKRIVWPGGGGGWRWS